MHCGAVTLEQRSEWKEGSRRVDMGKDRSWQKERHMQRPRGGSVLGPFTEHVGVKGRESERNTCGDECLEVDLPGQGFILQRFQRLFRSAEGQTSRSHCPLAPPGPGRGHPLGWAASRCCGFRWPQPRAWSSWFWGFLAGNIGSR